MDWEFTVYWKELMTDIINKIRSLMANPAFSEAFHQDMQSALYSALAFCRDIDNLSVLNRSLLYTQITSLIWNFLSQTNHINTLTRMMANSDNAFLYENQRLAESERLQVEQINAIGQKLFRMIRDVEEYYKLFLAKPDELIFEATDLQIILESTKKSSPYPITIDWLDSPVVLFTNSYSTRRLLLNIAFAWLDSVPDIFVQDVQVHITVSTAQQKHSAKLVFNYRGISVTIDELKSRLVPSLALENYTLDLLIATRLIEQQHGEFYSEIKDGKPTFTVYLPLEIEIPN